MSDLTKAEVPLTDALATFLHRERGLEVSRESWDPARLPPHLNMNFRVVDSDGKELAMSRDFAALKLQFADASRTVFSTLHKNRLERDGITRWDIGDIPETINFEKASVRYDGFPALVDNVDSVEIKIFDEALAAQYQHRRGLTRLFLLELVEQAKFLERSVKFSPVAAFQYAHYFPDAKNHAQQSIAHELVFAAFTGTFVDSQPALIRTEAQYATSRDAGKNKVMALGTSLAKAMDEALTVTAEARKLLEERYVKGWEHIGPDIEGQLRTLFGKAFLRDTNAEQLLHKASGLVLEQLLNHAGIAAAAAHDERALADKCRAVVDRWLAAACPALALTVATSSALLDLEAVIIDGSMDSRLIGEVIGGTETELDRYNWEGISRPQVLPGSIGADARAMGGAILPLYAHFAPTPEQFVKA